MAERVLTCPRCNAPLAPSRFARSIDCPYCGAAVQLDPSVVQSSRFKEALKTWSAPEAHGFTRWSTMGGAHWGVEALHARGEISDVYFAQRARWPSERVLLKVLRDPSDAPLFDREWEVLTELQRGELTRGSPFTRQLPDPVVRGEITQGLHEGRKAIALRWTSGFPYTLEAVRAAHPGGVEPKVAAWMWRRLLEVLSFLRQAGFVHGAVLPQHLLVEEGEHGLRLVGYSCADRAGEPLRAVCSRYESFYPRASPGPLEPGMDVQMAARCIAFVLGPATGLFADLVREVAESDAASVDPWALRSRVGDVARAAFGPPSFSPLVMPTL